MNENDVIITDDDDADSDEDDYETLGFSESLLPENILSPRGDLPRYRQAATCNLSCDPEQDSNLLSTLMCQGELLISYRSTLYVVTRTAEMPTDASWLFRSAPIQTDSDPGIIRVKAVGNMAILTSCHMTSI